jgi:hypothetical protein
MEQESRLHKIWTEQCDAARTIRLRYGLDAAFDYLLAEKLMTFAEASISHPEFKNDLPRFISEIRTIFSMEELALGAARYEHKLEADMMESARYGELDDVFVESPKRIAKRAERFTVLKSLLIAPQLGTA